MKTAKKSLVGVVKVATSFAGVNKRENSDSIVKIVACFLLGIIQELLIQIDSHGLKSGLSADKP